MELSDYMSMDSHAVSQLAEEMGGMLQY